MDKARYSILFREAVERALGVVNLPVVDEPLVEFHGKPNPTHTVTMDEALGFLWLSSDRFFRIVDVGVIVGEERRPHMFVRPSGHEPSGYADTWEPAGLGPFKVIGPVSRGQAV